jgi:hypothetical protein
MLTNYGSDASTAVAGELHRWFDNCEWRSIVVADELATDGDRSHDPLHFPGFASAVKEGPSV